MKKNQKHCFKPNAVAVDGGGKLNSDDPFKWLQVDKPLKRVWEQYFLWLRTLHSTIYNVLAVL